MDKLKQQGFYYGALLYAFLIPFPQKVVTIAIGVWVIFSLVGYSSTSLVKNKYLWLLPIFYASYFVGVFTSEQPSFQFMEYKLSLLIFPLLFFLHFYKAAHRKDILKALVWGLGASAVACLVISLYHSIGFSDEGVRFQPNVLEGRGFMESILYGGNYFFGRHLSVFHQTVYYALYLSVGIAVLLFRPNLFSKRLRLAFLVLFLASIFLVSNKASFIALTLVCGFKLWTWKVKSRKKWIGVSLSVMVLLVFALLNPRIKGSMIAITEGKIALNKEARFGFETRLLSWDAALSLIKEKPILGYGHSETQAALNARYRQNGYTTPLKESHNAHNLWLQSWLENGVFAIVLLIAIFYRIFKSSQNAPLFVAFALILLINSMFEGLFNRFSGISFFSFLACFMFSMKKGGSERP